MSDQGSSPLVASPSLSAEHASLVSSLVRPPRRELLARNWDVIVAGGGPAGLSAALSAATSGARVIVLERQHEFGSPIHTSGGTSIQWMRRLGIDPSLYHPLKRLRFVAPTEEARFEYPAPVAAVLDIRRLYQWLAEQAIEAGAVTMLATNVIGPWLEEGRLRGVTVRTPEGGRAGLASSMVVDATGFQSMVARGLDMQETYRRIGKGAEYDMHAPNWDQDEAVLLVGGDWAPSGYGWVFPYGRNRVRVGVGIVYPDSAGDPPEFLDRMIASAPLAAGFRGAQPVEYHVGVIPSKGLNRTFVSDNLLTVGDAASQASSLVGEGIRYSIAAGRLAGATAAHAVREGRTTADYLREHYEKPWRRQQGRKMAIAEQINEEITQYTDAQWDDRVRLMRGISAGAFASALFSDFTPGLMLRVALEHPGIAVKATRRLAAAVVRRRKGETGGQRKREEGGKRKAEGGDEA